MKLMCSFVGIGGNLVSIQASRISTSLHLNCLPGETPGSRGRCYNPCRTFFGSGKNQELQIKKKLCLKVKHTFWLFFLCQDQTIDLLRFFLCWSSLVSSSFSWPFTWWRVGILCPVLFLPLPFWLRPLYRWAKHMIWTRPLLHYAELCSYVAPPPGPDTPLHGRLHGPLSMAERSRPRQLFDTLPHCPRRPAGDWTPLTRFLHVVVDE